MENANNSDITPIKRFKPSFLVKLEEETKARVSKETAEETSFNSIVDISRCCVKRRKPVKEQ